MTTFPQSFPIARLERHTSAKGNDYFTGFLGGARITLLKSDELGRDGAEVWHLVVAEGKLYPPKSAATESAKSDRSAQHGNGTATRRAKLDHARPLEGAAPSGNRLEDPIPF